ncbi:hypothetical protein J8273_3440 [Carpediemonas membranifera]|uniref:Uncharacterized protein n=1 Tax=Carpediemonas membranifera TaxID=201153 RepID=A0A8J6BXB6_9EUKA|nr:hypothetical protein J8273_3440 [Carpediemonas membranifera]|eukprot:KAG9393306.1 hypothetical protein J8273_3440 [Carpediemonas membranifera]
MPATDSLPEDVKVALINAHRVSLSVTASIPGNIPSLLRHAYSRHFNEVMPLIPGKKLDFTPPTDRQLESLIAMLANMPRLAENAQPLLDRARTILTSGPPLSMNVELADGDELPVALHTLNQGAVWACLLGGGANPDMGDSVYQLYREKSPFNTDTHDFIQKVLSPEAKCLWFLCRKFFFTLNVAEKDGESYQFSGFNGFCANRMYMGRLFIFDTKVHPAFVHARMPRALEVYRGVSSYIARTPKGLWGWSSVDAWGQLGFKSSGFVDPTRLTFPACPKVAELEASLPPWEKHRMVTGVSMDGCRTFILTPVGTVMAGLPGFIGLIENQQFHPVAVPPGFVPDHIMQEDDVVILSMGDRQMISGYNSAGQLGLGHRNEVAGFAELPFRVDRVMTSFYGFNVFLRARQLIFTGKVPLLIATAGLLPGLAENDVCPTPTPLRFPVGVKGWFYNEELAWVGGGRTHLCSAEGLFELQFEATAVSTRDIDGDIAYSFRHPSGRWLERAECSDGIELVERDSPSSSDVYEIVQVDLDPASCMP